MKRGHKAHWANIFGFVIVTDQKEDKPCQNVELQDRKLYHVVDAAILKFGSKIPKKNIFLIAKQGKSKHTGIWNYVSIEDSNNNLIEINPKRNSHLDYFLPLDNQLTELCGKIVIIG